VTHLTQVLASLAAVCLLACLEPPEFEGTYEEETPLAPGRDYAFKLDLFRFGDEVGGVVRFYELAGSGLAAFNTPEEPYRAQSACALFGAVDLVRGEVLFSILEGPHDHTYTFRLSSLDPADIRGSVLRSHDGEVLRDDTFDMERVDTSGNIQCSPQAGGYEVTVELPALTVEDAARLRLDVVFGGYELAGEQRFITRTTAQSLPVRATLAGVYDTVQRVQLSATPPGAGLSAPADGQQFGLAYVVLYDDVDGDGAFSDDLGQDELLALSPDRLVIYLSGPPVDLHPDVADVFRRGVTTPAVPYGLYLVEREVRGRHALVTKATLLDASQRIVLQALGAENPRAFPVLVPQ
jgi:hypothetical protein